MGLRILKKLPSNSYEPFSPLSHHTDMLYSLQRTCNIHDLASRTQLRISIVTLGILLKGKIHASVTVTVA